MGGTKEGARIYCACALYFHSNSRFSHPYVLLSKKQYIYVNQWNSVDILEGHICTVCETTYQLQMLDHKAVCDWHFFGMKTILDWKDCKKFALKLIYMMGVSIERLSSYDFRG